MNAFYHWKPCGIIPALLLFSFFIVGLKATIAQCSDPGCLTDQLVINTGYDYSSNAVYPPSTPVSVVQDPHWILVNAPTNNGPVNLGSPAFVIDTYPAWDEMPPNPPLPSRYISAFSRAGANEANISGIPYVFQRKICICSDTTQVTFQDNIHVDNQVVLRLRGPGLGPNGVILSSYNTTTVDNFRNPPEDDGPVTLTLDANTYFLEAEMRNDNAGSPMGLSIACTITADKVAIADESCCNHGAFVSGFKFLDGNCNGIQEAGELLDVGWTINLRDALGGLVASTTTDISGYYFFNITTPGTYSIEEVAPAPWSQTFPSSPVTHTVNITGTEVISNLNFGNCCPDCLAFQSNASAVNFTCTSDGLAVTITPTSGLLPGDTYSVDLNNDNIFEIINVPAGQSTTYTFPHYGSFSLTFKASRIACGKPCEVEINKTILVEEKPCVDAECYEWADINTRWFIQDMCTFDGKVIAGGVEPNGVTPFVSTWDGSSWQNLPSIPVNNSIVYEVEPYSGDLYALNLSMTQQTLFRRTGSFWIPVRNVAINSNFSTSGPSIPFSFLSEMERTPSGLFVAFYQNAGAFTTHQIHYFDGSTWTVLPDPAPPGSPSLFTYYQLGQYNDEPLIRVDIHAGAFSGSTYLATWNGTAWVSLTAPFFMNTINPSTFNASGISSVTQVDNDLLVVGSFDGLGFGAPVPGTGGIARLNVAGGFFQSVGGGETSNAGTGINPIFITRAHVFGENVIVNGYNIQEMGGAGALNAAWYDGASWHGFFNDYGLYNASVATAGTDDLCEVFMGGEVYFGKVEVCCMYEDLSLNQTETSRKLYHTNGVITSSSIISATAEVTYKAGNGIILSPGFTVQPGALFNAIPEGCEDCCPPDPLTALPWLAPYVNNPNYSITQCMYNGDCIYQIQDFCTVSDGTTAYYDCFGRLICEQFPFGGTCSPSFNPTNCVPLQTCPSNPIVSEQPDEVPGLLSLKVFPNPLTADSRIDFNLPVEGQISLLLMDLNGNVVREISKEYRFSGPGSILLNTGDLPPGMYFLLLQTGKERITEKVIIAR